MNSRALCCVALALAAAALHATAVAGEHEDGAHERREHEVVRDLAAQGDILPLEQILQYAARHRSGRVLEIELERYSGLLIYEVEILDADGAVWEMNFDARSGELVGEVQED
jgi:uncharacterized membrane protein YkoI